MLTALLSKTLAGMLTLTLFGAIMSNTLNSTLLSSHYLEGQLTATNAYHKLSNAISTEILKDAGPDAPTLVAQVQTIITPAVLQQKITSTLDQLQAYYKGNGPVPAIDVSDLIAKAQAAGIPISADNNLSKPIPLAPKANLRNVNHRFQGIRLGAILLAFLLVVALLAISWERHKYAALPDVAITLGGLTGAMAFILWIGPGFLDKHVKFDFASNAFASTAHDLLTHVSKDLGMRLGIIAVILLVVGIGTRIWVARLGHRSPVIPPIKQMRPRPNPIA
ncbi:MAG TPA: hypothetical protein VLE99_00230 [Candidatus Saccharimonadales bacterium]|nr:hypothetical protein [Candidatus Saccharimonadales bacterium]